MTEELFLKFFHNRCSSGEKQEILNWIREESLVSSEPLMIRKIWDDFSPEDGPDDIRFERMLDKIHHLINLSEAEKREKDIRGTVMKSLFRIGNILVRTAAILFIPLLIYSIHSYNNSNFNNLKDEFVKIDTIEVVAPVGSRTFVELPDGTAVHLNHGSKLRYPQKFTGNGRPVSLVGEAYFIVSHNEEKPFSVETRNLIITALGTEFNVMSYPDDTYVDATLVSGKIKIEKKNNDKTIQAIQNMVSGTYLRYHPAKDTFNYLRVDPNKYTSWKDGILIFKNDSLSEITARLGRWYNVEFVFRNESVKNYTYTATFVDETLTQILDLLKMATPIKYTLTSRVKLPDGTFSKSRVYIDLKK